MVRVTCNPKVQVCSSQNEIYKIYPLKFRGKKLTFDPACVPTKTKIGRFLTGKVSCQPFLKRQCVPKLFTQTYQTFVEVNICGNTFGVRKYDHFVKYFQEMLVELMKCEPRLVIIPYPNCDSSKTGRPFADDYLILFSSYWCQIYVDKLEGRLTTVKMFVGHDMPAAAFNLLECAQKVHELNSEVRMSIIQASKVVDFGYIVGSSKTFDNIHWTNHYNTHPRLNKMDVQVKSKNINDPTEEERNIILKTNSTLPIFYVQKKEKERSQHSNG